MRSELNGVFFVNLEKVGRYGNYNETWQEADHGITEQISDWFAFVRWSISVCIVLISLAYAYSLIK